MADERDWAPIMAVLAAVYGFKPWDVERLTEDQIQMYLGQVGAMRLMRDLPHLTYAYSKYDDEAIGKLLADADRPGDPNSLRSRGWRVFIRQYQTDSDEAQEQIAAERLPLSQAAAAAIVALMETGELTREYGIGSLMWRTRILPIWNRLLATAG